MLAWPQQEAATWPSHSQGEVTWCSHTAPKFLARPESSVAVGNGLSEPVSSSITRIAPPPCGVWHRSHTLLGHRETVGMEVQTPSLLERCFSGRRGKKGIRKLCCSVATGPHEEGRRGVGRWPHSSLSQGSPYCCGFGYAPSTH